MARHAISLGVLMLHMAIMHTTLTAHIPIIYMTRQEWQIGDIILFRMEAIR